MISSLVLSSDWTSMRAAILSSSPGICSSWGRQSETLYVQAWSTRNILGGVKRYIKYSSVLLIPSFLSLSLSRSLFLLPYCNSSHSTFIFHVSQVIYMLKYIHQFSTGILNTKILNTMNIIIWYLQF